MSLGVRKTSDSALTSGRRGLQQPRGRGTHSSLMPAAGQGKSSDCSLSPHTTMQINTQSYAGFNKAKSLKALL